MFPVRNIILFKMLCFFLLSSSPPLLEEAAVPNSLVTTRWAERFLRKWPERTYLLEREDHALKTPTHDERKLNQLYLQR